MLKNLISLFIAGLFFSTLAIAQPELDTTFGGGGKMVADTLVFGGAVKVQNQVQRYQIVFGHC